MSQSALGARVPIAAGTVSVIVNQLVESGVISESAESQAGRGRPRRLLSLDDTRPALIGLTVSRDGIAARVATLAGRGLERAELRENLFPSSPQEMGQLAAQVAQDLCARVGVTAGSLQMAVSVPGAIRDGGLDVSEMEWEGRAPETFFGPLRAAGFRSAFMGNDGSYATLAESRVGAARGVAGAVVIFLERGLGGSAVVDGRLLRRADAVVGFGHTALQPGGAMCRCGLRGCLELSVSQWAFAGKLDPSAIDRPSGEFNAWLAERAAAGDAKVLEMLTEARHQLHHFCDIAVSMLIPERVVLTGSAVCLAPWLLTERVGNLNVPMVAGDLGTEAPLRGALCAAQDAVFADPLARSA